MMTAPMALAGDRARYRRMSAEQPAKPDLTADERMLLALLANGLTHRQIGREIGRSEVTARQRLWRLYVRLGANNAPHAVAIAIRDGLISTGKGA